MPSSGGLGLVYSLYFFGLGLVFVPPTPIPRRSRCAVRWVQASLELLIFLT